MNQDPSVSIVVNIWNLLICIHHLFWWGTVIWDGGRTCPQMGPIFHSVPWENSSGFCCMKAGIPASEGTHYLYSSFYSVLLKQIFCYTFIVGPFLLRSAESPGPGTGHMPTQRSEPAFAKPTSFHQPVYTEDLKGIKLWNMTVTFKPVHNQEIYTNVWHNLG